MIVVSTFFSLCWVCAFVVNAVLLLLLYVLGIELALFFVRWFLVLIFANATAASEAKMCGQSNCGGVVVHFRVINTKWDSSCCRVGCARNYSKPCLVLLQ